MDANQGDRVRVEVETEGGSTVLEGRSSLRQRPNTSPSSWSTDTTSAIGWTASSTLRCSIRAEDTPSKATSPAGRQRPAPVHVIHTGGTIASKVDYATGAVNASFEPEELRANVPELADWPT